MSKLMVDRANAAAAAPTPRIPLSALATLFRLTLRQQCRARRLIVLCVLFCLPIAIAILALAFATPEETMRSELETGLVFGLIAHALVPLTALLYAAGVIQDEIEEQTLTYLLVRPLPKAGVYLVKLAATTLLTIALAVVFTVATYAAIFAGQPNYWHEILPRSFQVAGALGLALISYCALFGLLGLLIRRSLFLGVVYIVVFEGFLASIDFIARRLTVMYYFRVLVERWTGLQPSEWSIELSSAPSSATCATVMVGTAVVASVIAVVIFTTREFRVKTPEGN